MTRFERWSVWTTTAVTALSGTAFFWFKHFVEPTEAWAVVNHPLQPLMLKIHILAAPLMLFAVAMVMTKHIWQHLRSGTRLGRRTGLVSLLLFAPLVITGYVLQVLTHQGWLASLGMAHFIIGLVYVISVALHRPLKRRRSEQGATTPEPGRRRVDTVSGRGLAWNRSAARAGSDNGRG